MIHLKSRYHSGILNLIPAGLFVFLFFSCESYRPADPADIHYVKVADVNRDTIMAIANKKSAKSAIIGFSETLSDTALIKISSDTLFSQHGTTFLLPITDPPLMMLSELSGDSLYIKYQPLNRPISGEVIVEITLQH